MNGYKEFANDIKLVFSEELKEKQFIIKHENWFKDEFCYSIILECQHQYFNFYIDAGNLIVLLINKISHEFINLDDLFFAYYPELNIKKIKSENFHHDFYEDYIKQNKSVKEQAEISIQHLCLGEINAYHKIIKNYLFDILCSQDNDWVNWMKQKGIEIYKCNVEGI